MRPLGRREFFAELDYWSDSIFALEGDEDPGDGCAASSCGCRSQKTSSFASPRSALSALAFSSEVWSEVVF